MTVGTPFNHSNDPRFVPLREQTLGQDTIYSEVRIVKQAPNVRRSLLCGVQDMRWEVHPTERAMHGQEDQWWLPDADITSTAIQGENFKDLMGHLRGMVEEEVTRKLKDMGAERHRFHFQVPFQLGINPLPSQTGFWCCLG